MANSTKKTPTRRTLSLDVEKYQAMLDAPHLSETERSQLLEAIWLLVVSFVDLGFEVKPAENTCGQAFDDSERPAAGSLDVVELEPTLPNYFSSMPEQDAVGPEGDAK